MLKALSWPTRLQNEFSRQTQSITLEVEKMQVGFDNEVNHFNTTVSALGKQGINHLLKGNLINNTTVLAARDGITTIAKTVGMDIGKYLKFKPWGAVKFAKGANGALAALGVALEAWDSWEQYKREEAFKKGYCRNGRQLRTAASGLSQPRELRALQGRVLPRLPAAQ
ncbi:labile enterotoxin output A [Pseudomonas aeruginosa]|nr:labile enterotoxin output A [Pseudomonas aeruginosa]